MFSAGFAERFVFPAPEPSYGPQTYKRHLCWIPWNEVLSPGKAKDEKCKDGIPCLWFPAPKAATVIIFFHANAEDLGMSFSVLKHMRDQFKVNVLSCEYPGYGLLNHLTTDEDGVYEVALTCFRYLVDEVNVRYSQIILFGRSLGTGPAVYLAAQYPVGGLILVNAIASVKLAVQSIAGRLVAWTWKERFPNYKLIANVSCATLFIHGENDGLLPPEHSLRLFKRCRARKLLITPPRMEHNSNLFGDASYLAVPAIHFFGFPGYYTSTPPRLPTHLFDSPERRARLREQMQEAQEKSAPSPWLCGCFAKGDPHHMDVTFCRQEQSVEDITLRFCDSAAGTEKGQVRAAASSSGHTDTTVGSKMSDLQSEQTSQSLPDLRREPFIPMAAGDEELVGRDSVQPQLRTTPPAQRVPDVREEARPPQKLADVPMESDLQSDNSWHTPPLGGNSENVMTM